jgi:hypothetical protein
METVNERLVITDNSSSSDSADDSSKKHETDDAGDCEMEGTEPLQNF